MVQIQVNEQVAEMLAEQAKARGLSLADFLAMVAQEGTHPPGVNALNGRQYSESVPSRAEIDRRLAAFDAYVTSMREWGEKNLPPGHVVDDSRESIYGGPEERGE